jgi:hypothetical protein
MVTLGFWNSFSKRRASAILIQAAIAAAGSLLASGCASIMNGRQASVAIDSYPSNAHVTIHDKNGREVASVNTPGVVSLKRNSNWLMPARYTATIEAPGYQTAEVPIRSTINPWILGNVVVGGIPGLIVDNATGACWTPKQDSIHQQLLPAAYAQQPPCYPTTQAASQASCQVPPAAAGQSAPNTVAQIPLAPAGQPTASFGAAADASANPAVARGPSASPSGSFYR